MLLANTLKRIASHDSVTHRTTLLKNPRIQRKFNLGRTDIEKNEQQKGKKKCRVGQTAKFQQRGFDPPKTNETFFFAF